MTRYIYPQNLKATANLWLWSMRDFVILAIAVLLSAVILVQLKTVMPAAVTPVSYTHLRIIPPSITAFL